MGELVNVEKEALRPAAVLEARNLWFAYRAGRPVLRDLGLRAMLGEVTAILGKSGSGKTTLLKLVRGLLPLQQGTIDLFGTSLSKVPPQRLDPDVAYIPQQLGLVRNVSVLENALIGALGRAGTLRSLAVFTPREVARAREILESLGLVAKAQERLYRLSGGERQRVAIARALMQRPRLLLADEFVSQLDPVTTFAIMDIVRGIADRGVAVVLTTHELDVVERYADRVIVLHGGIKVLDVSGREATRAEVTAAFGA